MAVTQSSGSSPRDRRRRPSGLKEPWLLSGLGQQEESGSRRRAQGDSRLRPDSETWFWPSPLWSCCC